MKQKIGIISRIAMNAMVAVASTLIIGILFEGFSVFNYRSSAFEFVSYSIMGSLFFFSLKASVRDAFAVLLVLFFIQCSLITRSFASVFLLRDVAYFVMVSVSIYVFFAYFHKPRRQDRRLEPLILGALIGLGFLVSILTVHVVRGVVVSFEQLQFMVLPVVENGFLIGLGIGLGILIVGTDRFARIQEWTTN